MHTLLKSLLHFLHKKVQRKHVLHSTLHQVDECFAKVNHAAFCAELYWHAWNLLQDQWHHAISWLYLDSYFNQMGAIAAYSAPPSPFDSHAHLLHGMVHANGFGHLARVNGREGGSRQLSGTQPSPTHNTHRCFV